MKQKKPRMGWTKANYEKIFGQGAWDGRFCTRSLSPIEASMLIERERADEIAMARAKQQANALSLPKDKEEELIRVLNNRDEFKKIRYEIARWGYYTYTFSDGSKVVLKKNPYDAKEITATYQISTTQASKEGRSVLAGRKTTSLTKLGIDSKPHRLKMVGSAFATLGSAMWSHVLKPVLAPLNEWLKVKPNEETTVQVRNDTAESPVRSTEGTETASQSNS